VVFVYCWIPVLDFIQFPPESTVFRPEVLGYFRRILGERRTQQLAMALCQPGLALFLRINTLRTDSEVLIGALANEGVRSYLADQALNAIAIPIERVNNVPRHQRIVVADKPSSENILLGSHLYRPGVLRSDQFREGDPVTIVNTKGHIVGSGIAAGESKELLAQKRGLFIQLTHPIYSLPSLSDLQAFHKGLFYSQSLSAMLVAPILDPQPDETIIDFCAAPGGKTTHIAQLTKNQCHLIAVDRSKRRLEKLNFEINRLGITCVETFPGKAKDFVKANPGLLVDRILVDPPCTALGVRPQLYDETTIKQIQSTASYQRDILDSAVTVLRSKGSMVYSTCTLTIEENEQNIQYLMEHHGFTLEFQKSVLGSPGLLLAPSHQHKVQRIYPDLHNLPGYFIARLSKP
jgi:16S rRNA C967 or C1407 C5-methylase (RsmB/RsmF family)